jgi:hypothetical protein
MEKLLSSKVDGCGGQVIVVGSVAKDRTWRRPIIPLTKTTTKMRNVLEAEVFVPDLILELHHEVPLPPSS